MEKIHLYVLIYTKICLDMEGEFKIILQHLWYKERTCLIMQI